MNGLALYAGYGGLDIGIGLTEPDYRTVCYVEREAGCAANLVARMAAKELHQAPIWDDSGTFEGKPWRGAIDILTAGFPCPEVSVAGKRKGIEGERWLWGDVARIIREAQPERLLLENVRGITSANNGRAHGQVLGDLAEIGFDVWWGSVPAARLGARHGRDRLFYVANTDRQQRKRRRKDDNQSGWQEPAGSTSLRRRTLGDTKSNNGRSEQQPGPEKRRRSGSTGTISELGNTQRRTDSQRCRETRKCDRCWTDWYGGGLPFSPPGPNATEHWEEIRKRAPAAALPAIYGMADGTSKRVDRLRMCGNGVYPLAAAYAWMVGQAALTAAARENLR